MMTTAKELNFVDFQRACGLPVWRVRAALKALQLVPRMEGRATFYERAWIDAVKEWDRAHMGQ
ncbi:MAG: hypothetical protein ACXWQR_24335 [Ktedonobacterales bacterium]